LRQKTPFLGKYCEILGFGVFKEREWDGGITMAIRLAFSWVLLLVCLAQAQRVMESINRGLVALPVTGGTYLSWRLFGTEPYDMGFNVYKGTTKLTATPLVGATIYTDNSGGTGTYTVRPVINGQEGTVSENARVFTNNYWSVNLDTPPSGSSHGESYSFSEATHGANDGSVGDLDGDGNYDIVLKWDPSNAKDNSQDGYTGPQLLDGIKLDGTKLWRINLGPNIRSGAHYTQFMVYDFDGDGRAEVICKTAPGTKDGTGAFLKMGPAATADNTKDYTNSLGRVLDGPEYLTVFDGLTGKELATVDYLPGRGDVGNWGGVGGNGGNDSKGNRVDRFTACVAYLDGVYPSVVMGRGYYGRTALTAWDWRDGKLTRRWAFDSKDGTNPNSGQGAHGISVADVDDDGKDEIIFGAMTLDDDGSVLYNTTFRHGDALHVGDLDPSKPGLEVYMIHENEGNAMSSPGSELHNAKTGEVYWKTAVGEDVGRGMSADIDATKLGDEFWGAGNLLDTKGANIGTSPSSTNFAMWWDGDLNRELEDGTSIKKGNGTTLLTGTGCHDNNSTKSNPVLTADLFGDWREEVIWRTSDNKQLRIYTTTIPTEYRFYTLMHNPEYRMAVAWQNVAYNQPPHVDYYLGVGMTFPPPKRNMAVGNKVSVFKKTAASPHIFGGKLLRITGGTRIALPWGYKNSHQVISLRDAFGKLRARGMPNKGELNVPNGIPGGMYYIDAENRR
jgi:rhamnogalacturonan endolyase